MLGTVLLYALVREGEKTVGSLSQWKRQRNSTLKAARSVASLPTWLRAPSVSRELTSSPSSKFLELATSPVLVKKVTYEHDIRGAFHIFPVFLERLGNACNMRFSG